MSFHRDLRCGFLFTIDAPCWVCCLLGRHESIHEGIHKGWRREAPPPSWMVVWALGRQQTQQQHMQMYAKLEHACTLYRRRLHPTKVMDLRNLQGVQSRLCRAGNIQCISYRQPIAAINSPTYFLPLAASAYYKYFCSTLHLNRGPSALNPKP